MNHPFLSLEDLNFSYQKERPLLHINQFQIEQAERLFLHGPSGSGKSTLLALLTGIQVPSSGKIMINNTDLTPLSQTKRDQFRGENIGYIFQSFNLIPYLTVLENILLPMQINPKRNREKNNSITESANELAHKLGITRYLNTTTHNLSIGEQQRVAACRALIGHPPFIICDEPTSSLDVDNAHQFLDTLLSESKKYLSTVLFVSHDNRLAHHFDRKVSLSEINKGKVP